MASELGVQTIQHTNGTDALTVGSDGVVTAAQYVRQSNPVAFKAILSADKTEAELVTVDSVPHIVPFDTVVHDTTSGFNVSTHQYTVPVTGIYLVQIHTRITGLTNYSHAGIYVNGVVTDNGHDMWSIYSADNDGDPYSSIQIHTPIFLTQGDKVMARGTDGGMTAGTFHNSQSFFAATLIG